MNEQDNQEEYTFSDPEGFNAEYRSEGSEEEQSVSPGKNKFDLSFLENEDTKELLKKAAIGLGVVIVVVFIYKAIFSSATKEPEPLPSVPTVSIPKPADHGARRMQAQELAKINQLSNEQRNLSDKLVDSNNQIINLQEQLTGYQSAFKELSNNLENAQSMIQQQAGLIQNMKAEIDNIKLIQDSFVKKSIKNGYFIQAIVPGRAWLNGPNGETVTVGLGTMIPGYGEVVEISTKDSTIKTRSGKVITISQQDS